MLQKILHFIKYHNAVSIGISLILVLSFSAMASEDIKNAVFGEEIITERGIDNSVLLAADLANFDLAMQITAVSQDPEIAPSASGESASGDQNYYITYVFKTLGVEDNRWQNIARESILTVSKIALADRDLGLYAQEELSEVADNELAYLKEVQTAERAKGETKVVQTTDYSGLIGLVLDVKNKILPGYEPVVEPPKIIIQPAAIPTPTSIPILTPAPLATPEPTAEAGTPASTLIPTPILALTPAPTPDATSTPNPSVTPTLTPTETPTSTPTPTPAPLVTPEPAAEAGTPTQTP